MDRLTRFFNSEPLDAGMAAVLEPAQQPRPTSYVQFHSRFRELAGFIERSCAPEDRIAIYLPAGAEAYASEMAALFSGRLFCPIDITHPIDRVAYYLADLQPKITLTDAAGQEKLAGLAFATVNIEHVTGAPLSAPQRGDGAYVIFTSGSTGLPKGVKVSRRSMSQFLEWSVPFYGVAPGERWAQFSSMGFDLSLVDLLTCLLSGGTLVPVARSIDRMMPARFVAEYRIGVWHSVPSLIPMLVREQAKAAEQLASLRLASFCGEPLLPQQAMSLFDAAPHLQIVNTYGPTEGTFFCTAQAVDPALCSAVANSSLPIGHPIPGWSFEFGESSEGLQELIIASPYIADGYISATPDQAKFGLSPSSGVPIYRTGDLVRRDGDHIFFAQRYDNQVKVGGNRLDLTEVEYQALAFGAVEAKALLVNGIVVLAVVLPEGLNSAELEQYFHEKLPVFAVPREIFVHEMLPRNANAKIDSRKLKEEVVDLWRLRDGEN